MKGFSSNEIKARVLHSLNPQRPLNHAFVQIFIIGLLDFRPAKIITKNWQLILWSPNIYSYCVDFITTNTYMMIRSNIYKENYKLRPIFCKNTENYLILSAVCLRYLLRKNLWSTSESFGSVFQLNLGFKNLRIR